MRVMLPLLRCPRSSLSGQDLPVLENVTETSLHSNFPRGDVRCGAPELLELTREHPQSLDPSLNLLRFGVDQPQDIRARRGTAIPKGQHLLDLLKGDPQCLDVTNERQAVKIPIGVLPVIQTWYVAQLAASQPAHKTEWSWG